MITFLAEWRHYIDHLAPVYHELPGAELYCREHALEHARSLGIDAKTYEGKTAPIRRDALAVVASRYDYFHLREGTPCVYTAHGNGQSFVTGEHNGYAGGTGLDHVVQFLAVNEHNAGAWRRTYPDRRIDVVGCPKLDQLPERRPRERPTVCVSFHWDTRSSGNRISETWTAWPYYRKAVEALVKHRRRTFDVIGHGHPRMVGGLQRWFDKLGIEWVSDFNDVLARADLYVNDCSSTLYEAATVMPVVVLNIPQYRREVEHGLRFWEYADVGLQVDRPEQLADAVTWSLAEPATAAERRREVVDAVYPNRGESAKRAAALIRDRHAETAGVNAAAA